MKEVNNQPSGTHMNKIPVDAKVELLPGRDEVYLFAQAGSRGTVRNTKVDEMGFPLVYIEWDRDHWKYNGEPDGWTFESHFQILELPDQPKAWVDFLIKQAENRRDDERCSQCGQEHDDEVRKAHEALEALEKATQAAANAEGWFMVTVAPGEDPQFPGMTVYHPKIFAGLLTENAADMIEAQIVHLATLAHQDMIQNRFKKREDK